jgi:hypothetical protein
VVLSVKHECVDLAPPDYRARVTKET